jgi:hypothetical protein
LWTIATSAGVLVSAASAYMTLSGQTDPMSWPYAVIGIFCFVSAGGQWLAFFPPRAYARWIAPASAAGS